MQLKQYLHIKIMKTFEMIEFPLTHFSETSFLKNDSFLCSVQADSYPPSQLVLNTLHTFFRFVLLYYLSFPCSNICLPYLANFLKSLVLHCTADCHLSIQYLCTKPPTFLFTFSTFEPKSTLQNVFQDERSEEDLEFSRSQDAKKVRKQCYISPWPT